MTVGRKVHHFAGAMLRFLPNPVKAAQTLKRVGDNATRKVIPR